jgi:hypothetical protein
MRYAAQNEVEVLLLRINNLEGELQFEKQRSLDFVTQLQTVESERNLLQSQLEESVLQIQSLSDDLNQSRSQSLQVTCLYSSETQYTSQALHPINWDANFASSCFPSFAHFSIFCLSQDCKCHSLPEFFCLVCIVLLLVLFSLKRSHSS